jgi:hypothetical protein
MTIASGSLAGPCVTWALRDGVPLQAAESMASRSSPAVMRPARETVGT